MHNWVYFLKMHEGDLSHLCQGWKFFSSLSIISFINFHYENFDQIGHWWLNYFYAQSIINRLFNDVQYGLIELNQIRQGYVSLLKIHKLDFINTSFILANQRTFSIKTTKKQLKIKNGLAGFYIGFKLDDTYKWQIRQTQSIYVSSQLTGLQIYHRPDR